MREKVFELKRVYLKAESDLYAPICVRWANTNGEADDLAKESSEAAGAHDHRHDRRRPA